ncbi:uncharacterized protein KY384_004196 [Bacidia gigantensis]|uniref:uncharacterized protein n=1 Tax=Bacidia gigantensis TaxID=2732470 RepID=UPI001D03FCA2|nr:uncharacterized protein KY384_004196 [Bacidia gigantensis]KAG8530839.1 hypothetical protein KY384_004196 [Bacidia gigantensis]
MASSFGGDIPRIKVESGAHNGQGAQIKRDPDASGNSPGGYAEEDIYEDAGDLDFADSGQNVFLARLPKFLWESWSHLDDDEEVQIGRIRIEGQPGDIKRVKDYLISRVVKLLRFRMQMSLMLDDLPKNRDLPNDYNMHVTHLDSFNTYVFNEKDLPGYRQYQPDKAPMHWLARKKQANRVEKSKSHSQYRRAVPKQTSLIGQVRTEINCQPVENSRYQRFTNQRALLSLRPKQKTKLLEDTPSGNVLNPGTIGAPADFRNFIDKAGTNRRKGPLLKTARIAQNELLDLIYECFKEYTYWPFKVLKQRVQQPESFLKSTLEMIAYQNKSGSHMLEWQLKPEAKEATYAGTAGFGGAKDEAAPDDGLMASFDGVDDLDYDDGTEMEDVKLELES